MISDHAAQVAQRYAFYTCLAAIVFAGAWHFCYDLVVTVAGLDSFRSAPAVIAAWTVYTVIAAVAAVALLRRPLPGSVAYALAGVMLVVDAVVIAACEPGDVLGSFNWSWGSVGWVGVLLLWHRPTWLRDLALYLAGNAAIMLAAMVGSHLLDGQSLARFLVVLIGSATLQLGYSAGAHALISRADETARLAHELAEADAKREAAQRIHTERLERYAAIQRVSGSLLRQLADGADPADPRLRDACMTAAIRLRRLITETADAPDPLLRTLAHSIGEVEDRGVRVTEVPVGRTMPELSDTIRDDLLRAPLQVLHAAVSTARVTVSAMSHMVSVAVLADADALAVSETTRCEPSGVTVTYLQEGGDVWVNSIWQRSP